MAQHIPAYDQRNLSELNPWWKSIVMATVISKQNSSKKRKHNKTNTIVQPQDLLRMAVVEATHLRQEMGWEVFHPDVSV